MNSFKYVQILTLFTGSLTAHAAVTVIHEYQLGETGSLGANNLPLDSVGSTDFTNAISGAAASVGTTGVFAQGSTAYLDTSSATNTGWYGADFAATVPVDNFALGVFARAAQNTANEQGDIFTVGGTTGSLKISLASNGWAASANNVSWIGGASGVSGSFSADQWVHLALIRQNGTSTFYIDGVAQPGTWGGTPVQGAGHLSVSPGGGSYFKGNIDNARVVTFDPSDSTPNIINTLQIPEPSGVALLSIGLLALFGNRKRQA